MGNAPKPAASRAGTEQSGSLPVTGEYHTIAPYIIVPRAAEFIDFLKAAFGATERFRVPRAEGSDLIMHAEVSLGDSIIELADAYDQIPAAPQAIHLYVD